MIRVIHDDLRIFLNGRMDADGADAEMCYRIVARQDLTSDDTPNYFMALPNPVDQKRAVISQTSLTAMRKAGVDHTRSRDVWNAQGNYRIPIRPGRWARAMTDIEDGNILDVFTMALDAHFGVGDITVEVLTGKALSKAYYHRSHCKCGTSIGDLANSCMRYDHNQGSFAIYEKAAKLAIVRCQVCQGIRARALLWDVEGTKYVDRRYGTQQHKQALLSYATQHGYADVWPGAVGAESKHAYSLAFPHPAEDIDSAPYVDSLFYWCRTCGTLSNRHRDCTNRSHDVAVLRGTHGTDHQGWWGRCPQCSAALDRTRTCPRRQVCAGCDARWCGDGACPNQCIVCTSCSTVRTKDTAECPQGCVTCTTCGAGNRIASLNQMHGRCRGCGEQVRENAAVEHVVTMKWNRYGHLAARCPHCNWALSAEVFGPRVGLVRCEHTHSGPYSYAGGHCPSCHHYLVLQPPEEAKPSKRETVTFSKQTEQKMAERYTAYMDDQMRRMQGR